MTSKIPEAGIPKIKTDGLVLWNVLSLWSSKPEVSWLNYREVGMSLVVVNNYAA